MTKSNGHTTPRSTKPSHGRPVHREAPRRVEPPVKKASLPLTAVETRSAFPPIADYAFLSDCQVNLHIAPDGNVEWLCLPRHDGASVFAAMLDRDAGGFRLSPFGRSVPMNRAYVPGSLVLETTWQTPTGWLVVRDALCMTPWYHGDKRSDRFRRAAPDWEAAGMLVRTIECTHGNIEVQLDCQPMFEYGRTMAHWEYAGDGYGEGIATADGSLETLTLQTDLRLGFDRGHAHARTRLKKGDRAFAALAWGDLAPPETIEEAEARIEQTQDFWQRWLDQGRFPDHPWRPYLQRSALTIKGLTYAPTGAVCAAATTSLPETPGGNRNWDYRFTWLRDSVFTLAVLTELGYDLEALDYTLFMNETVDPAAGLQIMYGIGGEKDLTEHELDHLSGYGGARPVRIGNGAFNQKQHDVWGDVVGLIYVQEKRVTHLPIGMWRVVQATVEDMIPHWKEPDRGIWEVRGEAKHFTSSKVTCWFAADRGAKLARIRGEIATAERWEALASEIREDVITNALDSRGVFTQHYGGTSLDASNLLMALLGFLPPDDPRLRATVLAIADELTVDGLVLRYRPEQTDDGLSGDEGTFTICSFWLVSALAIIGELPRARSLCEKLLTFASPLGLYAEEIDARTGRHLGNIPQAFSHLSLIDAVSRIVRAETE
ncbi:MAG: glycoside hydrolase family 15 protein [Polyangiaceae bacterium]